MAQNPDASVTQSVGQAKPRLAFAIATALGIGRLPKAPGTFGALVGVLLAWCFSLVFASFESFTWWHPYFKVDVNPDLELLFNIVLGLVGVWASAQVAAYVGNTNPPFVVIDKISGQLLALLFCVSFLEPFSWKYLVLGFVFYSVLEVSKPWPIRKLERLPSGWGIMADDWMAGVYAAILLRLALHFGFV
jgi:phosphatidylglycerophosphatase A